MVILSICIPTYNRLKYLVDNLNEIIRQLLLDKISDKIEICLSDNCSTDGTDEYVQNIINEYGAQISIKFNKNESNLGFDRNCQLVMNMAVGEYSWIIGSDDIIVENALNHVLELIQSNNNIGVFLLNRQTCDVNMNPVADILSNKWLRDDVGTQVFDFQDSFQERYYYSLCRSTGGLFAFISSVVYKTESVLIQPFDTSFIGCNYVHLFYWLNYLKSGKNLLYVDNVFVKGRVGLPFDICNSDYSRLLLDFEGFKFVKEKIFGSDPAGIDFINVLKYEHSAVTILRVYSHLDLSEWHSRFKPLLLSSGWAAADLNFIEKIGNTPNWYKSRLKYKIKNFFSFRSVK